MEAEPTDMERHKDQQCQQWDRVAAGWKKWWRTIENGAQQVSDRLVDLAKVEPGQRVLDIATGIGEPALVAASRVGSAGIVVATDISKSMLDIARDRASASGLTNVEFIEADSERLDFLDSSFDAILCRWGLTSLPKPSNALIKIRRMLTPDGSFAASVWDEASTPPLMSIATTIAQEMFPLAPSQPEAPSRFELTESSLERMMIHAGFTDVRSERMAVTLEFPSAESFTQYLMDVSPVLAALVSNQSSRRQREYRQRVAGEFLCYARVDGSFRVQNITICVVGQR